MTLPLVITGGDPAGVAPALVEAVAEELAGANRPLLYLATGGAAHLRRLRERYVARGGEMRSLSLEQLRQEGLPLPSSSAVLYSVDLQQEGELSAPFRSAGEPVPGRPGLYAGALSFESLKLAADYGERFGCGGVLTPPLSKEWVARSLEPDFSGHTGYLARRFERTVLMLMHGEPFSVIPLTEHVPLSRVPQILRERLLDPALAELLHSLRKLRGYGELPWALCSLNPHGGEGGRIGNEEGEFLAPWADRMRKGGLPLEGPLAADGLFMMGNLGRYRLVLCPCHDQALIPFKALVGEEGVNVTLGLPFPRTSPDHGTAYDAAAGGEIRTVSMRNALRLLLSGEMEERET